MVKRAVTFGCNYPGTSSALRGCWNDSMKMKKMLVSAFGYRESNITVILDKKTNKVKPTKATILATLRRLVSQTKKGDTLFVHYSGHGTSTRDTGVKDEKDGRDEAIYPTDGRLIKDDQLNDVLVKNFPQGAKLRVIMDCCHSSSNIDLNFRYLTRNKFVQENKASINADIVMISGCKDSGVSSDAYIGGAIGALTWAVCKCINNIKRSKNRGIKDFTWEELITIVRYTLRNKRFSQIPQLSLSRKDLLDDQVEF